VGEVRLKILEHPAAEQFELATVLHALSDPMRLHIVRALARAGDEAERPCGTFGLPITKSTCSHHFKVLREAGVIRQRHAGTLKLTSLRREDLDARFPGLLEAVLSAEAAPPPPVVAAAA
jgi:DNA-binding transcriptional ArsR family regulator